MTRRDDGVSRRDFLAAGGTLAAAATAGCGGLLESRSVRAPPPVEDRPKAVYVPSHVEGMKMADRGTAGRYAFALTYSFPHRFWLVTGTRRERVEIDAEDSVHLMLSIWDRETRTVLPSSNAATTITTDGETVASRRLWPMLSQTMGFHLGDNVALPGNGTYTVEVEFGPLSVRRAGAFAGAFRESRSVSLELDFRKRALKEIMFRRLEDRKGERDAVAPMEMDMPISQLPPAAELPGRPLGTATSGDARFVVRLLDSPPEGIDGDGQYLVVSARTPYNRFPLPMMSLAWTIDRRGESLLDGSLAATLHPELGYHYGSVVEGLKSGDRLTIAVDAPPQIARHEGYETAFIGMEPVEVTV